MEDSKTNWDLYQEYSTQVTTLEKELKEDLEKLDAKISPLRIKITENKNEIKKIEETQEEYANECFEEQRKLRSDLLSYTKEKIRSERTGITPIVPIDEDVQVIELQKKIKQNEQKQSTKSVDLEAQKAPYLEQIDLLEQQLELIKEERKIKAAPLEKAKAKKRHYKKLADKELEQLAIEIMYSPSFEKPQSSSTESTKLREYEKIMAEEVSELKATAYETKKQTELAKQQAEEARKQTELAKKQMQQAEREASALRMEAERQKRQQQEAARREANRIRYYRGVIYYRNGTTQKTGSSSDRKSAERMAQMKYDQDMKTAVSDWFKPTRYEVVED